MSSRRKVTTSKASKASSSSAPVRYYRRSAKPYSYYRKPQTYVRGKGAYYVSGGVYGQGRIGPFKAGASFGAGYSSGKYAGPSIKGLGAYSVSNIHHNVLIKPDIPQIRNTIYSEGGTIVRHREYLGPIITSATAGAFKIQSFPLNPAQAITFPWLSTIAQNFEEYKPNGLSFEFRSTASDAIASSTNLALGQVMMCTQYDPTDPVFTDDIGLLNYTWAQSGKVSDNVVHYVECDPKQSPLSHLYTRTDAPSNDSDLRFSDFGTFSIATSGLQGTEVQVGQLWVTYEFIMYKPKISDDQPGAGGYWHYMQDDGSVTAANCMGTIASGHLDPANNLDIVATDPASYCQLALPTLPYDATYQIIASWDGDLTASVSVPLTTVVNCTKVDNYGSPTISQLSEPPVPTTIARACLVLWVSVVRGVSDAAVQFSMITIPANSSADVYVQQVPYLDPNIYNA